MAYTGLAVTLHNSGSNWTLTNTRVAAVVFALGFQNSVLRVFRFSFTYVPAFSVKQNTHNPMHFLSPSYKRTSCLQALLVTTARFSARKWWHNRVRRTSFPVLHLRLDFRAVFFLFWPRNIPHFPTTIPFLSLPPLTFRAQWSSATASFP